MTQVTSEPIAEALAPFIADDQRQAVSEQILAAVVQQAVHTPRGQARNLLSITSDPDEVYFVDLTKAFLAVSGFVGGTASLLIAGPGLAAVAAFAGLIGTLGAFTGLQKLLPGAQGLICHLLYLEEDRRLPRDELKRRFETFLGDHPIDGVKTEQFPDALRALRNLGVVTQEDAEVRLKNLVIVRR